MYVIQNKEKRPVLLLYNANTLMSYYIWHCSVPIIK